MSTQVTYWIVALFLILMKHSESKNVVFLPFPVTSHGRLHAFAAVELAKMGHHVWLGLPSALDKRKPEHYPGVITFSYNDFFVASEDIIISDIETTINTAITTGTQPDWSWIYKYDVVLTDIYFKAMTRGRIIEYIAGLQPDLLVLDWFPEVEERIAIAYKLKIPFAILSAEQYPVTARIPFNPVAEVYNYPYIRDQASFIEQVFNIIKAMSPLFLHIFNDRGYMQQLFPTDLNAPAANELMSQAEVYIIESDPLIDYPRPTVPNVKLIGGVSVLPAEELREPFKSFVERSEKAGVGIAVLSFGSLLMNLHPEIEAKIMSSLKRLKLNTIWRANLTSNDPDRIMTSTWIPQNDLLGHKNVKVFISHSGTHSLYEALYHAVPTVCLPLFYDQKSNAERAEDRGYCLTLDILQASDDELVNVIEKVISSQEIKSKLSTASEIYRQLHKNPRQEAAFWLDHVMRYGGSYMRYSGQKIPMILFIMDYVLVFIAGIVFTLGFLLVVNLTKLLYCLCLRRNKHMKTE